ncbi:hypothetical protein ABMA28_015106 [Loxostege sticticalis]|uniref:Integrase catalytic domain-containing protein n=1 Tax=Loxostege sticticalis TaxID=481309 RepID=A0ABD0TED0_LOXSC
MALESLGLAQDKFASFLYPLVESALPVEILRAWNRSQFQREKKDKPLSKLLQFLKLEVESEERIHAAKFNSNHTSSSQNATAACLTTSIKKDNDNVEVKKDDKNNVCIWCTKSSHSSSECNSAMKMTLEERKEFLKKNRACMLCLKKGHIAKVCRKFPRCVVCGKRHYTLMCSEISKSIDTASGIATESKEVLSQACTNVSTVLLQTIKLKVRNGDKDITIRALLDSGAQRTFIKKSVAEELKMTPCGEHLLSHNLFGGNVTKKRSHKIYNFSVSSLDGTYTQSITALEQPVLCGYLPQLKQQGGILDSLQAKGIFITDCIGDKSEIGLLIGSDILGTLLTGRLERVDENLVAMETKLGWTIQGPAVGVFTSTCEDSELSTLHASFGCGDVEDFWKLETLGIKDDAELRSRQTTESEVQTFFENTVRRNTENRYEVRLPWKTKCLESNYELALKRLGSTTTRLLRLGIVKDYDDVFREWIESDIIEKVVNDDHGTGHYLSHHAVIRESSLTTKIRPVFNASATDKNGFSLNSCLEKGVNLIEYLPRLLIQFRKNKIGVTADIKKAFLQISLHPDDRDYLKFLWWRDINESPRVVQVFRHRRVVFGVTTSPYLLSATILHHLENYNCDTAASLRKSFYVDNCVVSVRNVEEMHQFIEEAKAIMLDGGFELRCWVSGPELVDKEVVNTSVLGLNWDPRNDTLNCKPPSNVPEKITKRTLLSIAQSTFDPLGFLSPTTIVPKLLIQKCWLLNLDWDVPLPTDIEKRAVEWMSEKDFSGFIKIPRCISTNSLEESENSLHIFCDGSQSAYACCIFLRSAVENNVSVQLVIAKARVAPSKNVTIPRLELLGALLASRLICEVRDSLGLSCTEIFWTDSRIVLAWLKKQNIDSVFVRNRVNEIASKTNINDWRHISSEMNPADLPSRGCNPKVLLESRWWEGPAWLKGSTWPVSQSSNDIVIETSQLSVQETIRSNFSDRLLYFGSYNKIVRTFGWCLRFISNCRNRNRRIQGNIYREEFKFAENRLFKLIQSETFVDIVKTRKELSLDIFVDDDNVLRVKTRLTNSIDVNTIDFISPILLPGKHPIIERLVYHMHKEFLHAGAQTLLSKLREEIWVIGGRMLAKRVVKSCMICKRFATKRFAAPVPPLPADRVHCGAPFQVCGVDFAGPLLLRSGEKCWIALFTCAVYRAVHLELCLSLSTEEFLLALRRFIARRGNVEIMYSDNGTNFRGAYNVFNGLNWSEIETKANKLLWRFSPPSAPWWGGFWERMVRTVKEILRRVLGRAALNFNELVTVLCEVESIINSRPLTATDSMDLKVLTPASFLLYCRHDDSRQIDIETIDGRILTSRWRYLTKLCADLKSRFKSEYLGLMAQKQCPGRTITAKVGDLVLVEAEKKRVEWPLGIVEEIFTGSDGVSRVARVRSLNGVHIRAMRNLYPLEITSLVDTPLPQTEKTTRSGRPIRPPKRLGV